MSFFTSFSPQASLSWVWRCYSAFPSTDAAKSAARAGSARPLQVSTTSCIFQLYEENQMQNKPLDSLSATHTVPVEEMKPRLSSTTSWGSDSEGTGSINRGSQIYFSTKARLSFRHQLDSNINAVDATYWGRPRASQDLNGLSFPSPVYAWSPIVEQTHFDATFKWEWR